MACDGASLSGIRPSLKRISLGRIDTGNQCYRISSPGPIEPLMRSLSRVGALTPPVLLDVGQERFAIVSGFRRLEALARLGISEVDVRLMPLSTPHGQCAVWAVADNALQRSLNPMETARALALLSDWNPDPRAMAELASELGLDVHGTQIEKILALNDLPGPIQRAVETDAVAPVMALELGRMDTSDALCLNRLFVELRPSLGKQREILALCREIAQRDGMSVGRVLMIDGVRDALEADTGDRNAKTARLRKALKQHRFPVLSRSEADFEAHCRHLKLPGQIQLIPPKQFEGQIYQLVLSFKSLADLGEHRNTLSRLLEEPAFHKILQR